MIAPIITRTAPVERTSSGLCGMLAFSLLIAGCQREEIPLCTFVADEICFVSHGYELDQEMISVAIATLGEEIKVFRPQTDYQAEISGSQPIAEYIAVKKLEGANARAVTNDNWMTIRYWTSEDDKTHGFPEDPVFTCLDHYYLLQHELIHVLAGNSWGVSREDNTFHNVPNMFIQWADNHGAEWINTAEGRAYYKMYFACLEKYGNRGE